MVFIGNPMNFSAIRRGIRQCLVASTGRIGSPGNEQIILKPLPFNNRRDDSDSDSGLVCNRFRYNQNQ